MIQMCVGLHVKSEFNETSNFLGRFSKNTQISNFIKILPVGAELFHVKGRTDRYDEANDRFSQFYVERQKSSTMGREIACVIQMRHMY